MITDDAYVEIELSGKHDMSLPKMGSEAGCTVNTMRNHLEADMHSPADLL
jgi:hypothetical protein